MNKIYRSIFTVAVLPILLAFVLALPAGAARYEDLTVGKLTVEKSIAVQGLLQAAANTTGKVFYVSSTAPGINAIGRGESATTPFATVDFAINQTRANKGDFIIVMPGHVESYTAANGFDADVAGITIVMLGEGASAPTFTFADTDATIACGAAGVKIHGGRYAAGISEVVVGISVEATCDKSTFEYMLFPEPTTSSWEFDKTFVLASGADDVTIQNNIQYRTGAVGATDFIEAVAGVVNRLTVADNFVIGEYSQAVLYSDQINTNMHVARNTFANMTTGQYAIELTAAATGILADNKLYTDTFATTLDPGSLKCMGNLASIAIDTGGRTIPGDSVLGDIADAAATDAVTSTDTLMAYQKQVVTNTEKLDNATLDTTPAANSLAAFVASGGTSLGTQLAASKSLVDAVGTNGTTVADTATGIAGMIGVNDADNSMDTSTVAANANGSVYERNEALQVAAAPSNQHPNYFVVTADMTSATWNTVAAHEIATVTGACRVQIMVEVTDTIVTVGTNGTIALGFAGNTSAIFSATALDAALVGDVFSAVYGSAATTPVGGADAQSALTHAILDVVAVGGVDIGYTIATNAGTNGVLKFHVWWTPLDSTGAVAAGAGGVL